MKLATQLHDTSSQTSIQLQQSHSFWKSADARLPKAPATVHFLLKISHVSPAMGCHMAATCMLSCLAAVGR